MMISMIVAMGTDRSIGKNNQLLWNLSSDLARFKKLTMGHHLIMGRKTFESIGKPLPGRVSVVLARTLRAVPAGVEIFTHLDEALGWVQAQGEEEVFICGGGMIYREALPLTQKLYLTTVDHADPDADTFFPEMHLDNWSILSEEVVPASEKNDYSSVFRIYQQMNKRLS